MHAIAPSHRQEVVAGTEPIEKLVADLLAFTPPVGRCDTSLRCATNTSIFGPLKLADLHKSANLRVEITVRIVGMAEQDHMEVLGKPEKDYTLVFPLRRVSGAENETVFEGQANTDYTQEGWEILLGMKKRGFGVGKWNGFGGKLEKGETIEQAAVRELQEESGLDAKSLTRVGFLNFVMHDKIMKVHVYTCVEFEGEFVESDEMRPKWMSTNDIDYSKMWPDDKFWVPNYCLKGKRFIGRFDYDDDDETIIEHNLCEQ
jgi:8-oxo-dGTP diphosphatase / 2-hydroxy-dATP diphosphatase